MTYGKDYNKDARGRFGKGNDGGPGRPKREIEQEYLDVTFTTVTPQDWATVVKSMIGRAKAGDVTAARFLADYMLGRPTERIEMIDDSATAIILALPRGGDNEPLFGTREDLALADEIISKNGADKVEQTLKTNGNGDNA